MTYQPHYRVTCSGIMGTVASPIEIFSYGFQFGVPGTGASTAGPLSPAALIDLSNAVGSYHGNVETRIASQAILTQVKVAELDEDGHYIAPPQIVGMNTPGSAGDVQHPFQVAYAVSLRGPAAIRRRRGRFYVPAPALTVVAATGRMSPGRTTTMSVSAQGFIQSCNTILTAWSPSYVVVIAGQNSTGSASARPAENAEVVEVAVGDVFDTQRRRRDALPEAYSVNSI